MFARDPFDIAPGAPRHMPASWFTLVLGLLVLVLCAWPLATSIQAVKQAEQDSKDKRQQLRLQRDRKAADRARESDPALLEKIKAQRELRQVLRMSWSGLFDALESAAQEVSGTASILSLIPVKAEGTGAQVGITALAVSPAVMVNFIRALEKDVHVREVQLNTQQPALNAGVEVVRFQLSVAWDPQAKTADREAPAASAPHAGASGRAK